MKCNVPNMKNKNIVEKFSVLNEPEANFLLSKIFSIFADRFDKENSDGEPGSRYSIAKVKLKNDENKELDVQILAPPDDGYICDSLDFAKYTGVCEICKTHVLCASKMAECPVCGAKNINCK